MFLSKIDFEHLGVGTAFGPAPLDVRVQDENIAPMPHHLQGLSDRFIRLIHHSKKVALQLIGGFAGFEIERPMKGIVGQPFF